MDVFKWSMPFLAQKIMGILLFVVQKLASVPDETPKTENNINEPKDYKASIKKIALADKIKRKNIFKAKLPLYTSDIWPPFALSLHS